MEALTQEGKNQPGCKCDCHRESGYHSRPQSLIDLNEENQKALYEKTIMEKEVLQMRLDQEKKKYQLEEEVLQMRLDQEKKKYQLEETLMEIRIEHEKRINRLEELKLEREINGSIKSTVSGQSELGPPQRNHSFGALGDLQLEAENDRRAAVITEERRVVQLHNNNGDIETENTEL